MGAKVKKSKASLDGLHVDPIGSDGKIVGRINIYRKKKSSENKLPACNSIYYNECQLNFNVMRVCKRQKKSASERKRNKKFFDATGSFTVHGWTTNFHIFRRRIYLLYFLKQKDGVVGVSKAHTYILSKCKYLDLSKAAQFYANKRLRSILVEQRKNFDSRITNGWS